MYVNEMGYQVHAKRILNSGALHILAACPTEVFRGGVKEFRNSAQSYCTFHGGW